MIPVEITQLFTDYQYILLNAICAFDGFVLTLIYLATRE